MSIQSHLEIAVKKGFKEIFNLEIPTVEFQATRKEFKGDITIVVFTFLKFIKRNPAQIGTQLGDYLKDNIDLVTDFNVVKGFLNVTINPSFFVDDFYKIYETKNYGIVTPKTDDKAVMVEYSSPNTNKPLHLGHVRNNLLGFSVAKIIEASGKKVFKTQIINDRGIHICKSMLAWQKFGKGVTPKSSGLKGDKLVGHYYVAFDKAYKEEINALMTKGESEADAKKQAPILLEAQEMLRQWEAGDEEVVNLWKTMNQWVYDGFAVSYKNLGVAFDKNYYESKTYLLGKDIVQKGLETGVFYQKEDGSVWIDLTDEGLDEKLVLRGDGTSVYITQDIGTAVQRFKEFDINALTYTVGNEQDYHFKVLFLILKKLGYDWAANMYHLSYGMVDLPTGKMKSREGTVVDADDLMEEMTKTAGDIAEELGKLEGYSKAQKETLYKTIGMGALKYYILKVDPKKRILFDPKASIDFNGNTGPFIQYAYARIQSILRKVDFEYTEKQQIDVSDKELAVIKTLQQYPETVQMAAKNHSPALIANYTYDLVKEYNSFYQSSYILGAENEAVKIFRTQLSAQVGQTIKSGFDLLGISVPERM